MNAPTPQAALYARVSSEQQTQDGTIGSQLEALEQRLAQDGWTLAAELRFVDEGYSGSTLRRPALERLRDVAAAGGINRLYVHSPDRLARKYAYQVLLVDELQRCGVELIFLNRPLGQSAEDDLLLQVQGMLAEYERAKILERSRRGKRHAAERGSVNVLSAAPYGYRYISKHAGGQARYEIVLEAARVVRQIFTWVGQERCSISEVCRRLYQQGVCSPRGKPRWDRTTIWHILKNSAYRGAAAFGKTQAGPPRPRLRPQRGQPDSPRRVSSPYPTPQHSIAIAVPALVSAELFAAVAEQLQENRRRQRQAAQGARYLLQGLLVCRHCGYAYIGKPTTANKGKPRAYAYYCCTSRKFAPLEGPRLCSNTPVRTDHLEQAVWDDVCALLREPARIEAEYQRRLNQHDAEAESKESRQVLGLIQTVRRGIARLIDAYSEGLLEKEEFEPRLCSLRERLRHLEGEAQRQSQLTEQAEELRLVLGRWEAFAARVREGLCQAEWSMRREILRTLVKQIEVAADEVRIVYRVPFAEGPERGGWQDCGRGVRRHRARKSALVSEGIGDSGFALRQMRAIRMART